MSPSATGFLKRCHTIHPDYAAATLLPATAACHCSLPMLPAAAAYHSCLSLQPPLLPVTAECQCCLPLLPATAACHCCLSLLPVTTAYCCCQCNAIKLFCHCLQYSACLCRLAPIDYVGFCQLQHHLVVTASFCVLVENCPTPFSRLHC
jgi:hypothetical protein